MSIHHITTFVAALALLSAQSPPAQGGEDRESAPSTVVRATPSAKAETTPVPTQGDAADDPAIWIHPLDPAKSRVLGTNKKGGLHVYSLDGRELQCVSPNAKPNNVDLIYNFTWGAKVVDLAVASSRAGGKGKSGSGLKVWTIDPGTGHVAELAPGLTAPTFDGSDAYGLCTYRSPKNGAAYVFVTNHDGRVEQYRLDGNAEGALAATKVRSFAVGSQAEGCVADRELGRLYVGEEDQGIWEYGAEPDAGEKRTLVAKVGENGLTADVEGLTIYYAPEEKGYLIASSQGSNHFHIYERSGKHAHVLTVDPQAGTFGDIDETDGVDVTNEATSERFPAGLLVVQDGKNEGGQNFKFFDWRDVAGSRLVIDKTSSARKPGSAAKTERP